MKKLFLSKRWLFTIALIVITLLNIQETEANKKPMDDVKQIKAQILHLANKFKGHGDPDFEKQHELDALIARLIILAPQKSLKDRLPIIAGAWYQVWGAYDYRKEGSRSVDPTIDPDNIYQVISAKGYYYNITLLRNKSDSDKVTIGLLRGEYKTDLESKQGLIVHFTGYPGTIISKSNKLPLWKLAELAEQGKLPNEIKIVPTFVVRLFFKGGNLDEVYTDNDLRITYGSRGKNSTGRQLFVMTRAH